MGFSAPCSLSHCIVNRATMTYVLGSAGPSFGSSSKKAVMYALSYLSKMLKKKKIKKYDDFIPNLAMNILWNTEQKKEHF